MGLWLIAFRTRGRMDLVIAVMQRTAILDVSRPTVHGGRRQRPDWESAALQRRQEVAVGLPERVPEVRFHDVEVWLPAHQDTRLPGLEAVDIRWFNRASRMETTRFTAVLNIDTEDYPLRCLLIGTRIGRRRKSADT